MIFNNTARELFDDLMSVCTNEDTKGKFFFVDQKTPAGMDVRVFSYHIASHSDWIQPGALECRGITFVMFEGSPISILVRTMDKFFNLAEVEGWATDANLAGTRGNMLAKISDGVSYMMDKRDGSLVSSYIDADGILKVKSKGSFHSDQALAASTLIRQPENEALYEMVKWWTKNGFTVNMEYTAPNNQIVLMYDKPQLKILNIRDKATGDYISPDTLPKEFIEGYWADIYRAPEDIDAWVDKSYKETGKEGYVIYCKDGTQVKLKNHWYVALHHAKDSINSDKDLVICVVEGATDDLRQLFKEDEQALAKIARFEEHVTGIIAKATVEIRAEYNKMRGHDRKTYALYMLDKFKEDKAMFDIAMQLYTGKVTSIAEEIMTKIKKYPESYVPR